MNATFRARTLCDLLNVVYPSRRHYIQIGFGKNSIVISISYRPLDSMPNGVCCSVEAEEFNDAAVLDLQKAVQTILGERLNAMQIQHNKLVEESQKRIHDMMEIVQGLEVDGSNDVVSVATLEGKLCKS